MQFVYTILSICIICVYHITLLLPMLIILNKWQTCGRMFMADVHPRNESPACE